MCYPLKNYWHRFDMTYKIKPRLHYFKLELMKPLNSLHCYSVLQIQNWTSNQYIIQLLTLWATERSSSIFFPPTVNVYMGWQIFEYFIVYNLFHDCKTNAILTVLKPEISLIRKHSPTKNEQHLNKTSSKIWNGASTAPPFENKALCAYQKDTLHQLKPRWWALHSSSWGGWSSDSLWHSI